MSAETPATTNGSFAKWTIRLLALVGVLACLALIAIAVMLSSVSFGRREPATVQAAPTKQVFAIGDISKVPHSKLITIEVRAADGEQAYGSGSLRGRNNDLRNIVLLDTETGGSRRILPDNQRRIDEFRLLPGDPDHEEDSIDKAIGHVGGKTAPCCYFLSLYHVGDETKDVMLGVIATGKQALVLQGVDGIDSISMPDDTHVALIVRQQRHLSYRVIDLTDFKVTANHPIAID